jgi:hypothetical protein
MIPPVPSRGYVLLMVLVVLAVAGSLLGLSARRTGEKVLEAGVAERDLQRRWAIRTLEAGCLPRAEAILRRHKPEDGPVPASVWTTLDLGGVALDVVVSDEQAKVNVNRLAAERDGRALIRAGIRRLSDGRWPLQIILRPVVQETGAIRSPPLRYASLEQVFASASADDLLGAEAGRRGPSQRVTCWGNGKVHVRRADRTVLREALGSALSEHQLARLIALREEMPEAGLETLLAELELEDKVQAAVRDRLTESSACHSVWLVVRGRTRRWYRLVVDQGGDAANDAGRWTFLW